MTVTRHIALCIAAAMLLVGPLKPAPALPPTALAKGEDVTSTWLYQLEPHYGRTLQPLNPLTLGDMPAIAGVTLGGIRPSDHSAWPVASADGSTLARVSYLGGNATSNTSAHDITVRVFDLATGVERARFHPRVPILAEGLSPDGSQLYGPRLTPIGGNPSRHAVWYAISTSGGRTLDTVQLSDADAWPAAYDAAGARLYAMDVHPFNPQTHRPRTPSILAYDVRSGRQVAALEFPGVLAGSGVTDREVEADWLPGIALSPDGHQLALLDGNSQTLRLIDAGSMKVVKTEALTHPTSVLDRLGDWLGVVPQTALAKGGEGVVLFMRFSPDGHRLYVTGRKGVVDAAGKLTVQDLGLQVVDVDSGEIVAQAQQNGPLGFSPDGSSLYTLSGTPDGKGWVLRRDDAMRLRVIAERAFDSYPQIVLLSGR